MSIEQNLLRSNAYFAALMLKIMKQLILLNGLVLKKMYQFIPRPSPLPPGAGEKRFLPLSPSLRGRKGEGGGQVGVLNCYKSTNHNILYKFSHHSVCNKQSFFREFQSLTLITNQTILC